MSDDLINPPQFIREREAWFKAGANAMGSLMFAALFILAAIVALVAAVFDLDGENATLLFAGGSFICNAGAASYIALTARSTALKGGVQVDRF